MPKRFTSLGAIIFGGVAAAQAARIFYGFDVVIDSYHVPMQMSYIAAAVAALMCFGLFRDASA